jgi:2-isopropylmalate synthase
MKNIELFDTTPRDGNQGREINLSTELKKEYIDRAHLFAPNMIIEVSYAQSDKNPKEVYDYIRNNNKSLVNILSSFGSTHKTNTTPNNCPNMKAILESNTDIVTIFGKTWKSHIKGLNTTPEKYLKVIEDSVKYLKDNGVKRVIYDAEHFFSGYNDDKNYALKTLESAIKGGADTIVLCNTKGGLLPVDVIKTINEMDFFFEKYKEIRIGFHGHNDSGCAVANSLTFFDSMLNKNNTIQIQGTIGGHGERCGNSDLLSIIPLIIDKYDIDLGVDEKKLKDFAHDCARLMGVKLSPKAPYVGLNAFAHKAGIHIYNQKRGMEYHHTDPERWGNKMMYLITSMSGKEMIKNLAESYGYDVDKNDKRISELLNEIRKSEDDGYKIYNESAEHLILVHKVFGKDIYSLELDSWVTNAFYKKTEKYIGRESQTILKGKFKSNISNEKKDIIDLYNGESFEFEEASSTDKGPVDSQYKAVRKTLAKKYPYLNKVSLIDFKVGITKNKGSESAVIVYITHKDNGCKWRTQGVSENILEASLNAIYKGFQYRVLKEEVSMYKKNNGIDF